MATKPTGPTPTSLAKARTDVTIIAAQLANARLRIQRGQLIDRGRADRAIAGLYHRFRDRTLDAPARRAAILAAEHQLDSARLHIALDKVLRQTLHEIADGTSG